LTDVKNTSVRSAFLATSLNSSPEYGAGSITVLFFDKSSAKFIDSSVAESPKPTVVFFTLKEQAKKN
jgi:hypothetical protein